MERNCDACGTTYVARRSTSRYCSSLCRTRVSRAGGSAATEALAAPRPAAPASFDPASLAETVRARLVEAKRETTPLGRLALLLADRLETGRVDTGSSTASLSKELRAAMGSALEGSQTEIDQVDEIGIRRAAKQANLTG